MRRRWVILIGAGIAVAYVAVTAGMAYARWFDPTDRGPIITTSDVLTGWATFPRHAAHDLILMSWNPEDPDPTAPFPCWDAVTTGAAALVNVVVVALIVGVIRRRRRAR